MAGVDVLFIVIVLAVVLLWRLGGVRMTRWLLLLFSVLLLLPAITTCY